MFTLLLSLLLSTSQSDMSKMDLSVNEMFGAIGQQISQNNIFKGVNITNPTDDVVEDYFPFIVDRSLEFPRLFSFFGIEIEQLHFRLNSANQIQAIFIVVDNQDIVERLNNSIGLYKSAMGASIDPDNPPSVYSWIYNGMCVGIELKAYGLQFGGMPVRKNTALIVFNNCDICSYMNIPQK